MDTKLLEFRAEAFRIACVELREEKEQERKEKEQYRTNWLMLKAISKAQTLHIKKLENEVVLWRARNLS